MSSHTHKQLRCQAHLLLAVAPSTLDVDSTVMPLRRLFQFLGCFGPGLTRVSSSDHRRRERAGLGTEAKSFSAVPQVVESEELSSKVSP